MKASEVLLSVPADLALGHAPAVLRRWRIRNALAPHAALDRLFGFAGSARPGRRIVVVNSRGRRTGLIVNDVVGQRQTVVKPLSAYHRGIEGLAGGTILGDGSVALILDAAALVRRAEIPPRLAA